MLVEEIARLTGTLKFNVEARPLVAFEKRLNGVINLLREFSTLANKKFTVKVALDSKSLRAQIDRATNSKILLNNVDVSKEALALQGKRIQDHLNKTTIRLDNIKVDISKLVEQKRFIKTMMGQLSTELPVKLGISKLEADLKRELKGIESRNPLKIKVDLNNNNLAIKLRRSMIEAQKRMGELKINVADPKVQLRVDRQHLINEIRAAISGQDFRIRVGAQGNGSPSRGSQQAHSPSLTRGAGQGLSTAAGFARGAIPGLGAAFAFSHMNTIQQQMQAQANAMTAVMGSEGAGKEQSAWVKNLSNTIGMDYRQVAPSYNKMLASGKTSGMSTEGVQNIFQGVSEYGRVMGLDSEAMKGSMRAIEQMMNKGQVMSEELKGQLAERMPGAISAMAEAAGFKGEDAVAKLFKAMENGEVKSKDVLEKFAAILAERSRKGDALAKAMESTAAQQARMNNAFTDAVMIFSEGGFDSGMASFFKTLADAMTRAEPLIRALGGAFDILIKPVNAVFTLLGDLGELWPDLASGVGMSEKALAALAVTVATLMLPFGPFVVALGAAALALEDLVTYSKGGNSIFGEWVKSTEGAEEAVTKLKEAWTGFTDLFKSEDTSKIKETSDIIKGIGFSDMFVATIKELTTLLNLITSVSERFSNAGQFAAQASAGSDSLLEANLRNIQGLLMGKEWTDQFLKDQTNSKMPLNPTNTPISLMANQGNNSAPVVTVPITLTVQAPAGVTDPKEFAKGMQTHIQEITVQAVRDAFGAVRAQQAERK